ncbi:NADH-quinone oxidoreductase subunit B family protein [Candidatus Azambacteria bacterium]|nr:NADH-quinone oxidoreductase subunit B family protein [Candidatus Azambacteria bacterium]MBI3684791.1 NADH-quinone oxidoreductase subunit B family protein [Candidatus Azambacteria bacterium]
MLDLYRKIIKTGAITLKTEKITKLFQPEDVQIIGKKLNAHIKKLFGRSLAIRQVSAGSCNACEIEINALANAYYDMERFGISIVASPRHADALLVTGPVTRALKDAVLRTYEATPDPKIVIACGSCACDGGIYKGSYATLDGVDKVIPVDVYIRGCPPTPRAILAGILHALESKNNQGTA